MQNNRIFKAFLIVVLLSLALCAYLYHHYDSEYNLLLDRKILTSWNDGFEDRFNKSIIGYKELGLTEEQLRFVEMNRGRTLSFAVLCTEDDDILLFRNETGDYRGVHALLVSELSHVFGFEPKYVRYCDVDKLLADVSAGKIDYVSHVARTPSREEELAFTISTNTLKLPPAADSEDPDISRSRKHWAPEETKLSIACGHNRNEEWIEIFNTLYRHEKYKNITDDYHNYLIKEKAKKESAEYFLDHGAPKIIIEFYAFEYLPMFYLNSKGELSGLMYELVDEFCSYNGIEFVVRHNGFSYAEAVTNVADGQWHSIFPYTTTSVDRENILITDIVFKTNISFFTKIGNETNFLSKNDAHKYRIGLVRDTSSHKTMNASPYDMDLILYDDFPASFDGLIGDEIDYLFVPEVPLYDAILKVKNFTFKKVETDIFPEQVSVDVVFGFSKNNAEAMKFMEAFQIFLRGYPVDVVMKQAEIFKTSNRELTIINGYLDDLGIALTILSTLFSALLIYLIHHRRNGAFSDPKTGLKNYKYYNEYISRIAESGDRGVCVACLNIKGFRKINERYGRVIGDEVIKKAAHRLQKSIDSKHDTLIKMSGDEYLIVSTGKEAFEKNKDLKQRFEELSRFSLTVEKHSVSIDFAIGVVVFGADTDDLFEMLELAEHTMLIARKADRPDILLFDRGSYERQKYEQEVIHDFRNAGIADEFEMYYQPIVNTDNRDEYSAESLIRWNHPTRGFLLPEEFIEIVEEKGFFLQLYEPMFEQVLRRIEHWHSETGVWVKVSFNLSASVINDKNCARKLIKLIERYKIDVRYICIEITEDAFKDMNHIVNENIRVFRSRGIEISMDDFGTAYSSLSKISEIDFNNLKVDKSFIDHILTDRNTLAILRMIREITDNKGSKCIIEGVENDRQLERVRELGFKYIQGFLFYRPGSWKDIQKVIEEENARRSGRTSSQQPSQ